VNAKDDAQFGPATPANDIAMSLAIIRAAGAGTNSPGGANPVVVVNVFDDTLHTATLTSVTGTVTNSKIALRKHLYGTITVKENTTTIDPAKYSIDAWGNFKDITLTGELEGKTLGFTGKYVIPAAAADIVGTIDSNNVRTGMKLADLCYSQFKYTPKIIIAPKYSTLSAVYAEGRSMASKFRARWIHDSATGDTVADAIANRGSGGTIGWNTTNEDTDLVYPWLKTANAFEAKALEDPNGYISFPHSAFRAGIYVLNDNDPERGYWTSPSNLEINGAAGPELDIYTSFNDSNAENQQLNANGIITVLNIDSLREYGNRHAGYPVVTGAESFINIQRVDDIVAESMEIAAAKYNDRNIGTALIDIVLQEGNNTVAKLIQRGALLPGSIITYSAADNPTDDLADGNVKFRRKWMTGTPAERITFYDQMDINLLKFPNS